MYSSVAPNLDSQRADSHLQCHQWLTPTSLSSVQNTYNSINVIASLNRVVVLNTDNTSDIDDIKFSAVLPSSE